MYPYFEFTCQILSYANSPVSLLPILPVYGVSNGLLFGISRYRWIEILISLNHYNISKSTYPSFIGKSNYRTCWCLWTGTCVVPGHRHPPWRTMAAGTKAVHIAKNQSCSWKRTKSHGYSLIYSNILEITSSKGHNLPYAGVYSIAGTWQKHHLQLVI